MSEMDIIVPPARKPKRGKIVVSVVLSLLLFVGVWARQRAQQGKLNDALIAALKRGDSNAMNDLLDRGADVDARGQLEEKPTSPLLWQLIAYHGFERLQYPTALNLAAISCQPDAVKLLLERGANVNSSSLEQGTPLYAACESDAPDSKTTAKVAGIVQMLINRGATVNVQTDAGWTPLMAAIRSQNLEAVKILIASGADARLRSRNDSALSLATGYLATSKGFHDDDSIKKLEEEIRLLKKAGAKE